MCKPYWQFLYGIYTLIQIQSYLFIINQPRVSFQFFTFKESSYMVFTSTYHYFYPVSHFETANGIHYLNFCILHQKVCTMTQLCFISDNQIVCLHNKTWRINPWNRRGGNMYCSSVFSFRLHVCGISAGTEFINLWGKKAWPKWFLRKWMTIMNYL